jgi:hypothetical protein
MLWDLFKPDQVEKLRDGLTRLPIIQKQNRVRTTRDTVIFAPATHANLKFTTF